MRTTNKLFLGLALLILSLASYFEPLQIVSAVPPYTWNAPTPVEQYTGFDQQPSGLQASNGTIWLAWQSNRFGFTGRFDILYKTRLTNGTWLPASRLTTSGQNQQPALAQLKNNTIFLFWAYKASTHFQIYYKRFNADIFGNQIWSVSTQLTTTALNDTLPSPAVGRDGSLWLVWTRHNQTQACTSCAVGKQVYYKTLKAGLWSSEAVLTSDTNWNFGSSVTVSKDGTVRVVWSNGQPSLSNFQIYYKTYNGTAWSSKTLLASSTSGVDFGNYNPSIMQDRNGTIWLFWGRDVIVSTSLQAFVLYNKFSVDNGKTWSPEARMTQIVCPTSFSCIDNEMPNAIQSINSDRAIWVFYSSDGSTSQTQMSPTGFDIWVLNSPSVYPVHDVDVSSFFTTSTLQYPGGLASIGQSAIVTIGVTIADPGDFNESVTVSLTATNTTNYSLGIFTVAVRTGSSVVLFFNWNTTNVIPARYGLSATANPVPKETLGNMGDNNLALTNQVHILPLGDVDQDGSVTITDISVVYFNYGFACGSPRYNPYADVNGNCIIDIIDVGVVDKNYGIFT